MPNTSNPINIIFYSLLITIAVIIIIPLIGSLVNLIITGILRVLLGIFDASGTLYGIFVYFLTFPGILVHELSHALFAFITGAKINRITFYHLHEGNLGCVHFTTRGPWFLQKFQLFMTSCAPVVIGLAAEAGITYVLLSIPLSPLLYVLLIYLLISILVHMEMSIQDLINYASGSISFFILSFAILLIYQTLYPRFR